MAARIRSGSDVGGVVVVDVLEEEDVSVVEKSADVVDDTVVVDVDDKEEDGANAEADAVRVRKYVAMEDTFIFVLVMI